jgi:hypothetical protein
LRPKRRSKPLLGRAEILDEDDHPCRQG